MRAPGRCRSVSRPANTPVHAVKAQPIPHCKRLGISSAPTMHSVRNDLGCAARTSSSSLRHTESGGSSMGMPAVPSTGLVPRSRWCPGRANGGGGEGGALRTEGLCQGTLHPGRHPAGAAGGGPSPRRRPTRWPRVLPMCMSMNCVRFHQLVKLADDLHF